MRIIEILTENNRAPLYHVIRYAFFINAILSGTLAAKTGDERLSGGNGVRGISFTRSKHFAMNWRNADYEAPVVLQFDQNRMRQDGHRFVPFDYWGTPHMYQADDEEPLTQKEWATIIKQSKRRDDARSEAEEFHYGPVEHWEKYVEKIIVPSWRGIIRACETRYMKNWVDVRNADFWRAFLKLVAHPKLATPFPADRQEIVDDAKRIVDEDDVVVKDMLRRKKRREAARKRRARLRAEKEAAQ